MVSKMLSDYGKWINLYDNKKSESKPNNNQKKENKPKPKPKKQTHKPNKPAHAYKTPVPTGELVFAPKVDDKTRFCDLGLDDKILIICYMKENYNQSLLHRLNNFSPLLPTG